MTPEEAVEIMADIVDNWPGKGLTQEQTQFYLNRLAPLDAGATRRALQRLMLDPENRFIPAAGYLAGLSIREQLGPFPTAEEAWGEALAEAVDPPRLDWSGQGDYLPPRPPMYTHDLVRHAVWTFGPTDIAAVVLGETNHAYTISKAFCAHYDRLVSEVVQAGELPEGVGVGGSPRQQRIARWENQQNQIVAKRVAERYQIETPPEQREEIQHAMARVRESLALEPRFQPGPGAAVACPKCGKPRPDLTSMCAGCGDPGR